MKLRTRLAVTSVAVVVPLVVGVLWLDARTRHEAAEQGLRDATLAYMDASERARCEADAAAWGGRPLPPPDRRDGDRGPGGPIPMRSPSEFTGAGLDPPVLWAYDAQLHAAHPGAPQLAGPPEADLWPGATISTLVRMPWAAGPCAFVLAEGSSNPGWIGALLPRSPAWLAPAGAALLVLLASVGPVVRRVRRLTRAVRETAAVGFTEAVPAEGHDEITELAEAFGAASREVRTLLAAKDQRERALRDYLANTTHDVMIPLTVLQSHLTTIHDQRLAGQEVELASIVHAMNEAHYLGALAHNLAAAAKLDAGEPQIARAPVELGALVERVLARHRPVARQLGVSIDGAVPDQPLEALADVTLLEQAVNNIVYNSIRHNRSGGSVGITLDRIGGDRFRIRVVDDGPGIAAEELARITERGYRGREARTRAPGGQGLGLAIVVRVAEALGLSLRLQASEYGGLQVDVCGDELTARSR